MPRIDQDTSNFRGAVDAVLNFLLPQGSGPKRSLQFELEAVTESGETIRYGITYYRPHNYTQVYAYLQGEPSVVVKGDSTTWGSFESIPLEGIEIDEHAQIFAKPEGGIFTRLVETLRGSEGFLGRAVITAYQGEMVTIPGKLICYANHDTCYRDYGVEALSHLERKGHAPVKAYRVQSWRVHSITVAGPKGERWPREVQDGQWVNPNPETLTGIYALYTGMGALAHTVGKHRTIRLNLEWELFDIQGEEAIDKTPRDENYYNSLQAITRLWFDDAGRVIRIDDTDCAPETFDRDFLLTHWELPESEFTYGIGWIRTYICNEGTYLTNTVRDF